MSHSRTNRYLFAGLGVILAGLLILSWFQPLNYHVLIGDDLIWLQAYNSGYVSQGFLHSILVMGNEGGKFRPVSNALIVLSTNLCRNHYDCFVYINYTILLLNAILIAICAYLVSAKWWPSIGIAALALILSRCAYYAVFQVMGLMENISITFVLLFIIFAVKFIANRSLKWLALEVLFFLLALYSHERFIVLFGPLVLSLLLRRDSLKQAGLYVSLALVVLLTGSYLLVKQSIFHADIFTGTANTSVLTTFQVSQFLSFLGQGFLNLIGFNVGPTLWSGKYFLDAGPGGVLVGVFLTGALAALIVIVIRQGALTLTRTQLEIIAFLVMLIGALIVSASITFRQEYRWLYAPFAAFVLLVCLLLSAVANIRARWILAVTLCLAFTAVDVFYKPFTQKNLSFLRASRMAEGVKTVMIDKIGGSKLSKKALYLVTSENPYIQDWTLAGDYFFKLYSNDPDIKVYYVNNIDALPTDATMAETSFVFQIQNATVFRVPNEVVQQVLSRKKFHSGYRLEYDFINNFPSGSVIPRTLSNPPIGRPASVIDWQDNTGANNQTMTLVSPSSIEFPSVPCGAGSNLIFRAGMPYAAGDGANLYVDIQNQGTTRRLADISLKPSTADKVVAWSDYNIPISNCTGAPISVTFGADSPMAWAFPDSTLADSIALADAKLVTPTK
jgi:hypothetical protein